MEENKQNLDGQEKEQAPEIQADEQLEQEEAAQNPSQPTEEEMKAVSPIGGLFPKWDRKNQSILKILLYCFLCIVILMLIGYFFK